MTYAPPPTLPIARPVRSRALGCCLAAAAAVLAVGGYLMWANSVPPPPPPDRRVLPSPNGFDALVAAVNKLHKTPEKSPIVDRTVEDPKLLRAALAPDEAALDEVRRAMRMPYLTPAIKSLQEPFPYMAKYRDAARKFSAQSRAAKAEGKAGEAADDALDAIEIGSVCGRGGTLIHHLVGYACAAIGTAALEPCVAGLSAKQARQARTRLDRVAAGYPRLQSGIREDRRLMMTTLHGVFRGKINPDSFHDPEEKDDRGAGGRTLLARLWWLYPKPWAYGCVDRGYSDLVREAEQPYSSRNRVRFAQEVFSQLLLPVMEQSLHAETKKDAVVTLLRTELALREYRARNGTYPERLTALVPGILPSVPVDPYGTGPLMYRRQGAGYVLYSVGPDKVDDGGKAIPLREFKPESKGDLVAGTISRKPAPK